MTRTIGLQTNYQIVLVLGQLLCFKMPVVQMYTFDQQYSGVIFRPYVKLQINNEFPAKNNYTSNEVRMMLEVILEKFTRVATLGMGSKNGSYKQNVTFFNNTYIEAYTSEIAAGINLQHRKKKITIFQGIKLNDSDDEQSDTEVELAKECTLRANQIYPGTVEGLMFSISGRSKNTEGILKRANQTQTYLKLLRNSSLVQLKLGISMDCGKFLTNDTDKPKSGEQIEILRSILQDLDFVICKIELPLRMINLEADEAFASIGKTCLGLREYLQTINGKLEVMARITWPISEYNIRENTERQTSYWEAADDWAKQNRFPVWFFEAFDNPRDNPDNRHQKRFHSGLWRLTDNLKSDQRDGYIEKILEYEPKPLADSLKTVFIVTFVVGTLVVIVFIALIVFLLKRGKQPQPQLTIEEIRHFIEGMSNEAAVESSNDCNMDIPAFKFPYDTSFEIDKNQLRIDKSKILGTGYFGRVYKAVIFSPGQQNEHVALKVAKQSRSGDTLKEVLSEIKLMIYIGSHPNIVALRGAYTAELENGIVYIATELCDLGSLESFLRPDEKCRNYANVETDPIGISIRQMLKWSHEIACGMEYLGTKNVVHADLATRNVLLTAKKIAKISDFGLSRRMYNYPNYVKSEKGPLPWRWMAIESIKWGEFSVKSDVWSFGVTLWEIFSLGEIPFSGLAWTPKFVKMLVAGTRLDIPNHASLEIYDLMTACWQMKPDQRPGFSNIQERISDIVNKED